MVDKTTKKITTEECICGSHRLPVFFADGVLAGHMCKECGTATNADPKIMTVLWNELSGDSLDDAQRLLDAHGEDDKKFDMQIREIPTFEKR